MNILSSAARRVADVVREMLPRQRIILTDEERDLAVHLRTNDALYGALTSLVRSRINGRDQLPVPSDPLICKSLLERNAELRWLLAKLEYLRRSPMKEGAENGEPPAA